MADYLSTDVIIEKPIFSRPKPILCLIRSSPFLISIVDSLSHEHIYSKLMFILCLIANAAFLRSIADCLSNDVIIGEHISSILNHILCLIRSAALFRSMADCLPNDVIIKEIICSQLMHILFLITNAALVRSMVDRLSFDLIIEQQIYLILNLSLYSSRIGNLFSSMAGGLSNDVIIKQHIELQLIQTSCLVINAELLRSMAACLSYDAIIQEHILCLIRIAVLFRSMADCLSNDVIIEEHISSDQKLLIGLLRIIVLGCMADRLSNNIIIEKHIFSRLEHILSRVMLRDAAFQSPCNTKSDCLIHQKKKSDCLPNELIVDILSRLPVKSLMKFRCVSKAWCSLISSPNFIATHLNRSLSNSQHPHSLFVSYYDYKPNYSEVRHTLLLSLNQEIEQTGNFFADRPNCIELRDIHQRMKLNFLHLVGSSNGLLCLANMTFSNESGLCVLWNPSIQKVEFLPKPDIEVHSSLNHSVGFGYERMTDDYKLVRLVYRPNTDPPQVEIYTLQTGKWRSITAPGPPYLMENWSSSVFVNGAVHWAANTPRRQGGFRNVIVWFNMKDEDFGEMGMPQSLLGLEDLTVSVALHEGLLALVRCNQFGNEAAHTVWVMKEYGVPESWTKVFDVRTGGFDINSVIGFTKSGEVLVNRAGRLFSLRPSSERCVDLPIVVPENTYLDTYAESLVMLNVADRVPWRQGNSSSSRKRLFFGCCTCPWNR